MRTIKENRMDCFDGNVNCLTQKVRFCTHVSSILKKIKDNTMNRSKIQLPWKGWLTDE